MIVNVWNTARHKEKKESAKNAGTSGNINGDANATLVKDS